VFIFVGTRVARSKEMKLNCNIKQSGKAGGKTPAVSGSCYQRTKLIKPQNNSSVLQTGICGTAKLALFSKDIKMAF